MVAWLPERDLPHSFCKIVTESLQTSNDLAHLRRFMTVKGLEIGPELDLLVDLVDCEVLLGSLLRGDELPFILTALICKQRAMREQGTSVDDCPDLWVVHQAAQ